MDSNGSQRFVLDLPTEMNRREKMITAQMVKEIRGKTGAGIIILL
jgi:hypothetical protein